MKKSLSKEWIKENSIKCNCSVADFFQQIVIEDFFYRLFESEKPVRFVLTSDKQIYGKTIGLCFKESMDVARREFDLRVHGEGNICWTITEEEKSDEKKQKLYLEAQFEDMKVPVVVKLECRENELLYSERKEMQLLLEKDSLLYSVCAPEQQLSECIHMILDRLELISSMDYYDKAFEILNTYTVDGRRFAEALHAKKNTYDETILFKIKEYRDYHYMEKRWNSYVKNKAFQQKKQKMLGLDSVEKKQVAWSELVDYICKFIGPIYLTMCKDEIFIGDWMPELGRFM